jgi:hypothetical protein
MMALPRKLKTYRYSITSGGVTTKFERYSEAQAFADELGGARIDSIGLSAGRATVTAARTRCLLEVMARDGERCFAASIVSEIACHGRLDGHELLPRGRGGDDEDPANVRLLCRGHHDWTHAHPNEAVERGLTIPTGG